jgi:GxxExxY protein
MLMQQRLSERVIGLAIDVHRALGPGLLESVYETCLAFELKQAGIAFRRQVSIPVIYRGVRLETGFRADLLVAGELIVEVKAVDRLLPAHEAQALTYLRMSACQIALLFNFNALRLKDGLRRFVHSRKGGEDRRLCALDSER